MTSLETKYKNLVEEKFGISVIHVRCEGESLVSFFGKKDQLYSLALEMTGFGKSLVGQGKGYVIFDMAQKLADCLLNQHSLNKNLT